MLLINNHDRRDVKNENIEKYRLRESLMLINRCRLARGLGASTLNNTIVVDLNELMFDLTVKRHN